MVHGNSSATCLVAMLPSSSVGNTLPISKIPVAPNDHFHSDRIKLRSFRTPLYLAGEAWRYGYGYISPWN